MELTKGQQSSVYVENPILSIERDSILSTLISTKDLKSYVSGPLDFYYFIFPSGIFKGSHQREKVKSIDFSKTSDPPSHPPFQISCLRQYAKRNYPGYYKNNCIHPWQRGPKCPDSYSLICKQREHTLKFC